VAVHMFTGDPMNGVAGYLVYYFVKSHKDYL